MQNVALGNIW